MDNGTQSELDELDWRILQELQLDARLSYSELGRRVSLSQPAVAERVRRLEATGVIRGYHADIDPGRVGRPVTVFIRLQTTNMTRLESVITTIPEVSEAHRVTGDDCAYLKLHLGAISDLGQILEQLSNYARSSTSVVISTFIERPVQLRGSKSGGRTGG